MSRKTKRSPGKPCKRANKIPAQRLLQPDPEQENEMRAARANLAVQAYRNVSGSDMKDALSDLLSDCMHLCDRDPQLGNFYAQLHRAQRNYLVETANDENYPRLFEASQL